MKKTVQDFYAHIRAVQRHLFLIIHSLISRALDHDKSKFSNEEIEGYTRFEMLPDGIAYGSEEHQALMKAITTDNPAIPHHYENNDHHPEFYVNVQKMDFLSIQEMVSDWAGAHEERSQGQSWPQSVVYNINKHDFSEGQIWLIRQVAVFLMNHNSELREGITPECPKLGVYPKGFFLSAEATGMPLERLESLKTALESGKTLEEVINAETKGIAATEADAQPLKPSDTETPELIVYADAPNERIEAIPSEGGEDPHIPEENTS